MTATLEEALARMGVYRRLTMFFDAGVRSGNPGVAAVGVYTYLADDPFGMELRYAKLIGHHTNNEAEWLGLLELLGIALQYGTSLEELNIKSDSKLVVNQARGEWRVRNNLIPLHERASEMAQQLVHRGCKVTIEHVRRQYNKDADAIVTELLDAHTGKKR
jgi:ribonuclease HI